MRATEERPGWDASCNTLLLADVNLLMSRMKPSFGFVLPPFASQHNRYDAWYSRRIQFSVSIPLLAKSLSSCDVATRELQRRCDQEPFSTPGRSDHRSYPLPERERLTWIISLTTGVV